MFGAGAASEAFSVIMAAASCRFLRYTILLSRKAILISNLVIKLQNGTWKDTFLIRGCTRNSAMAIHIKDFRLRDLKQLSLMLCISCMTAATACLMTTVCGYLILQCLQADSIYEEIAFSATTLSTKAIPS